MASAPSASAPRASAPRLSGSQWLALVNTQKESVGAPRLRGLAEYWQNILRDFWNTNINTPCKVLIGPLGNLFFHVPAPDGQRCTFPNISNGRPITGQNPDGTLVPDTSTARGGKRKAMRNTRNKRSKRMATRRRR